MAAERKAQPIPEQYLDLFEKRSLGFLATLMPDGSPQVTPLWASYDGEHVLVNAAKGRQKDLNMRARPRVAICMIDPDNTGRYLAIRGPVTEITSEGAVAHGAALAKRYSGSDNYTVPPRRHARDLQDSPRARPRHGVRPTPTLSLKGRGGQAPSGLPFPGGKGPGVRCCPPLTARRRPCQCAPAPRRGRPSRARRRSRGGQLPRRRCGSRPPARSTPAQSA